MILPVPGTSSVPAACLVAALLLPFASAAQQPADASLRLRVLDATTLGPIQGAHVTFPDLYRFWITDSEGYAPITAIPPGDHRVTLSMSGFVSLDLLLGFSRGGAEGEVRLARDIVQRLEEALVVVSSSTTGGADASARIRVTDADTRQPVVGARVTLQDLFRFWITDAIGNVSISDIPPGAHPIEVSRLGYASVRGNLTFDAGATAQVDVSLTAQPVDIEGITVAVRSGSAGVAATPMEQSGFDDRYGMGLGYQLRRQDIERTSLSIPSDIFSQMPGVRVVRNDRDDWVIVNPRTTGMTTTGTASPGDLRRGAMMPNRGCRMSYYLDGVPWQGEVDDLSLEMIEALEVYTGPSQIPPAYSRTDNNCGVVLIWTRTGVTNPLD